MKNLIGLAALNLLVVTGYTATENANRPHNLPAPAVDTDYYEGNPEKTELGRLLFFDKILSGNQNIACGTCHHPEFNTSDGLALGFGEGPEGLGTDRHAGDTEENAVYGRVPRNSPALFNLGAREFTTLFHDGRVQTDSNGYYEGGFITPAKWKLPTGLENPLAAQAMFPVTSAVEMAGQKGENPIADAASLANAAGAGGIWELIAERLQAIPEYVELFKAAYPEQVQSAEDITYVMAANAIAAFESDAFRADDSPFDQYLREEAASLDPQAQRGMELFYGRAECGSCHAGTFQTDHDFYAIAMPQIGPGKGDGGDATYWAGSGERTFVEDYGRGHVTVRKEDRFKFRTPTLRNVELTAPYGHDGAYETLEEVVRHHQDPVGSLERYAADDEYLPPINRILEITVTGSRLRRNWLPERRRQGFLMRDTWVQRSESLRSRIAAANELDGIALSDADVADLLAFLGALTDPSSRDLRRIVPDRVPSGLPVENE